MKHTNKNNVAILRAFRDTWEGGCHTGQVVYEHGRYWINCNPCGKQWAVHETAPSGFYFEEVSAGDGYCEESRPASDSDY